MKIKDFNNIKNQYTNLIKLIDTNKILNPFILSVCLEIEYDIDNLFNHIHSTHHPIFFSNQDNKVFNFFEEHSFSILNEDNYDKSINSILNLISDIKFLNEDLNDKVYMFGGLNFNNQDKNIDVWSNVPVAKFTLPRFTLIDSKLIVNMYVKDKTSFKNNFYTFSSYINCFKKNILDINRLHFNSKLLDLTDISLKNIYKNKINNFISNISKTNTSFTKVVFSRYKKATFEKDVPIFEIFRKLYIDNRNNMNFLFSINDNIKMLGSTPELILSKNNDEIKSESIAGSNFGKNDNFISDTKELIEQKIVTDYILNFFKINTTNIKYNKIPKIKKSSNIEHLHTYFEGSLKSNINILDLLKNIHPTPAIAGYPKEDALNLIKKSNENRGWYGGPIGWIDNKLNGNFYLNIRSGLGINNHLYLFSGSGITNKSTFNNEWEETEHKFKSMIDTFLK